ncbi:hypothetical protein QM996_02420 [Sinorhizobium chiapasense]
MSNNTKLIEAIKDAENALAKAMNTLRRIAAEREGNPQHISAFPENPQAEAQANMLCCSCDYCTRKRFGSRYNSQFDKQ